MTRTMLLGPAGAGKSRRVLGEVIARIDAAGRRGDVAPAFLVLVPTYSQAEHLKRQLLRHSGRPALLERGIATFEQLAERRTGVRLSSLVPAAVRDAILELVIARHAKGDLAEAGRFPGMRAAALRLLDELKTIVPPDSPRSGEERPEGPDPAGPDPAGPDPLRHAAERIAATAPEFGEGGGQRAGALLGILREYQNELSARGLLDHGDLLLRLLDRLRAEPVKLDLFAVDGFTDLTDVQTRIVHRLAEHATTALVTVTGDASERERSPFDASERLRSTLAATGFTAEVLPPGRRFDGAPALANLERRLAGDDVTLGDDTAPSRSLRFISGADPEDEADRVARIVLAWTCEGVARSEILVVVRSLTGEQASRLLAALARHGVPARRMGRRPLTEIPAARSVIRAMRLLASCDGPGEALAAVCAGDARGVSDDDADGLGRRARDRGAESFASVRALALGGPVRGSRPGAEDETEPPLPTIVEWTDRIAAARRLASDRTDPPEQIADRVVGALAGVVRFSFEGDVNRPAEETRAAEDAAALRAILDSVRDTVSAFRAPGRGAVTAAEFVSRAAVRAAECRAAAPDARDDAVHVVDAEEARQWEARRVVVSGLRLGEWPGAAREDLFFSDAERRAIEKTGGLRLPARLDDAERRERLLFYSAATRARDAVVFSTSVLTQKGDPAIRSPFVDDAMLVLPPAARRFDGESRTPGDLRPAPGESFHRTDLVRTALAGLTERFAEGTATAARPASALALAQRLVLEGDGTVRRAAAWHRPPPAALDPEGAARRAMGRVRERSATSLASFAQCPFRHFAEKGLGLAQSTPSSLAGIDAIHEGFVAHDVLETVFRGGDLSERAVDAAFDASWGKVAGRFGPGLRTVAARARLRRALRTWVESERSAPLCAGFRPAEFEWGFGSRGRAVRVGPGAGVGIVGSADRIDVDGSGRAVVIDWKWSNADRFSGIEDEIAAGAELQLPIYALAVTKGLGRSVAAVGYVTLKDGKTRWLPLHADAPAETRRPKGLPPHWGEGDGSKALAAAEAHVVRLDGEIRTGRVEVAPRDEDQCAHCAFADLCRYEGRSQ